MPQQREATIEDIISGYAKDMGIPPSLALAVAKKESSLNPNTKPGDNGKAIGLFQLHEPAAQDAGGFDRNDPIANAYMGVKYLKGLSDKYDKDLEKILVAYNGGQGNLDKGVISPNAQAYAAEVMATISGEMRQSATPQTQKPPVGAVGAGAPTGRAAGPGPVGAGGGGRASGAGGATGQSYADTAGTGTKDEAPEGFVKGMARAFDPRTTEGRVNLAAGAASFAAPPGVGAITRAVAPKVVQAATQSGVIPWLVSKGVLPWMARQLAAPAAAAAAGGGTMAVEQAIGSAPKDAASPAQTALEQGVMEAGSQALLGFGRRVIVRPFLASRVGQASREYLKDLAKTVQLGNQEASYAARQSGQALKNTVARDVAGSVDAAQQSASRMVGDVTARAKQGVSAAKDQLAQVDLDNEVMLRDAAAVLSDYAAPDVGRTAGAVRAVVSGQPGVFGDAGPATRAFKEAGEKVAEAAKQRGMVPVANVKAALNQMGIKALPAEVFPRGTPDPGQLYAPADSKVALAWAKQLKQSIDDAALAGKPPELDGVLGLMQKMPNEISGEAAHQLKRVLDEAVSWDKAARKSREQVTKGVRTSLREALSSPEYDAATEAYAKVAPLYRRGVGLSLIKAIANDPDKAVNILKESQPFRAAAVRRLLVDQSAAGGDAQAGQQAWQLLREQYAYNKIIKAGAEGLAERVQKLVKDNPKFTQEVFGDEAGQVYLSNLHRIGDLYAEAVAKAGSNKATARAGMKAANEQKDTAIARAKEIGQAGVKETRQVGEEATRAAAESADKTVHEARMAGIKAKQGVSDLQSRLADTKLVKSEASLANEALGVAQSMSPSIAFKAKGILRMMTSPAHSADIIEWGARSNMNYQKLRQALLSPTGDRVAADVLRAIFGSASRPSASSAQAPEP